MSAKIIIFPDKKSDKSVKTSGGSARVFVFPVTLTQKVKNDYNPFRTHRANRIS
jgi:hypothetical protein